MAFRKKGVKVTPELLNDVLWDVKEKFFSSDAPEYLKKQLRRINPNFHIVRHRKWDIVAQAWMVGRFARKDVAKKCLKLKQSVHPVVTLDGDVYFPIIQINKGAFQGITRRGLFYVLAHELAHLLQIVNDEEVDGTYSYSSDADHDKRWLRLTLWMGGRGTEYIEHDQIWC